MPLTYVNKEQIRALLNKFWQKSLNTSLDPANNKHFETGPNPSDRGLYGDLTDRCDFKIAYQTDSRPYEFKKEFLTDSRVDNTNGLIRQPVTVNLAKKITDTTAGTWTISNAFKVGANAKVEGKADILVVGGKLEVGVTVENTLTVGGGQTFTQSSEWSVSQTVPVDPPKGRVYKAVLTAYSGTIKIPFTIPIHVSGGTETWFSDRVNGRYNHSTGIGSAFEVLRSWGNNSPDVRRGSGPGEGEGVITAAQGTIEATRSVLFEVVIVDVTPPAAAGRAADLPIDEGIVIERFSVRPRRVD